MTCHCNNTTSIDETCKSKDETWNTCPEKFRTIIHYIENSLTFDDTKLYMLLIPHTCLNPINSKVIGKNLQIQKKLMKIFQISKIEMKKLIIMIKNDEEKDLTSDYPSLLQGALNDFYEKFIVNYDDFGVDIPSKIDDLNDYETPDLCYLLKKCSEDLTNSKNLILSGLIYESIYKTKKAIKFYKQARELEDPYAYYLLAILYDCGAKITQNEPKGIGFYLEFYNRTESLDEFYDSYDKDQLTNAYLTLYKNNKESKQILKENKQLQKENEKLKEYITELQYMPNGVGYMKAKEHFETLVQK